MKKFMIFTFFIVTSYAFSMENFLLPTRSDLNMEDLLSKQGVYFGPFSFFKMHNHHIFYVDTSLSKIFILNENLKVIESFGSKGQGPGEFQKIIDVYITDKYIYVFDISAKVCIFTQKGHLKRIVQLPGIASSFAVDEERGYFIFNTYGKENIKLVDILTGKIISRVSLPVFEGVESVKYTYMQRICPVIANDRYIFIRMYAPEVLVCDTNFKLLKTIDLVPEDKRQNSFINTYLSNIDENNNNLGRSNPGLIRFCNAFYYDSESNLISILGLGSLIDLDVKSLTVEYFHLFGEKRRTSLLKQKYVQRTYLDFFIIDKTYYFWSDIYEGVAYKKDKNKFASSKFRKKL